MRRTKQACRSKIRAKGLGKGLCADEVNRRELKMGCKVELEHGVSRRAACGIALDHLAEDPRYYTKLRKAGL